MQQIARLLELPTNIVESMYQPSSSLQSAASLRAMPGGATVSSKYDYLSRARMGRQILQRQSWVPGFLVGFVRACTENLTDRF